MERISHGFLGKFKTYQIPVPQVKKKTTEERFAALKEGMQPWGFDPNKLVRLGGFAGSTPTPPEPIPVQAEYQTILDRGTALGYELPSSTEQERQNRLVYDLKQANLWTLFRGLYVFDNDTTSGNFQGINWAVPSQGVRTPAVYTSAGYTDPAIFRAGKGWEFNEGNYMQVPGPVAADVPTSGYTMGIWQNKIISVNPSTAGSYHFGYKSAPPRYGLNLSTTNNHKQPDLKNTIPVSSYPMTSAGFQMVGNTGNTATNGVVFFTNGAGETYYNGITFTSVVGVDMQINVGSVGTTSNNGSNFISSGYWVMTRGLDATERNSIKTIFSNYWTTS